MSGYVMRISDWGADVCSSDLDDPVSMPTIFGLGRFSIDRRPSNPQPTTGETSVSAPVLQTMIQPESEGFHANAAHNRALRDELYARVAEAALGGNAKSRERPTSRGRSEEHTSELQSLMRISYAVFCLKKKKIH